MKLKKLLAALTGAVTALTMYAPLTAGADYMDDLQSFCRSASEWIIEPEDETDIERNISGISVERHFLGFCVQYDGDLSTLTALGGHPVQHGAASADSSVFCIQPLGELQIPEAYAYRAEKAQRVNLPPEYRSAGYALISDYCGGDSFDTDASQVLLNELMKPDCPLALLGSVYVRTERLGTYTGSVLFQTENSIMSIFTVMKRNGYSQIQNQRYAEGEGWLVDLPGTAAEALQFCSDTKDYIQEYNRSHSGNIKRFPIRPVSDFHMDTPADFGAIELYPLARAETTDYRTVLDRQTFGWGVPDERVTDSRLLEAGHEFKSRNRLFQGFLVHCDDWNALTEFGGIPVFRYGSDEYDMNASRENPVRIAAVVSTEDWYRGIYWGGASGRAVNIPPKYLSEEYAFISIGDVYYNPAVYYDKDGAHGGYSGIEAPAGKLYFQQLLLNMLNEPDCPLKLIGAVYVTKIFYSEYEGSILVTAKSGELEGVVQDYSLIPSAGGDPVPEQDGGESAAFAVSPLPEAISLCETLMQDERVIRAEHPCWWLASAEPDETAFEIVPLTQTVRGDLDENGRADVLDAVLLARLVGDDTGLEISEQARSNADMNGDGACGPDDLNLLMRKLALY